MCVASKSRDRRNQAPASAEKYDMGFGESSGIRCVVTTRSTDWACIKEARVFVLYYYWSEMSQVQQYPLYMIGMQLKRLGF